MDSQACVFKVHVNITLRMMNNKCIFASKLTSKTSNMVNVCGILFISVIFLDQFLEAVKIYEFGTTLEEKSRVVIKNNAPTPEAFTLCLDFYSRLDKTWSSVSNSSSSKTFASSSEALFSPSKDQFY